MTKISPPDFPRARRIVIYLEFCNGVDHSRRRIITLRPSERSPRAPRSPPRRPTHRTTAHRPCHLLCIPTDVAPLVGGDSATLSRQGIAITISHRSRSRAATSPEFVALHRQGISMGSAWPNLRTETLPGRPCLLSPTGSARGFFNARRRGSYPCAASSGSGCRAGRTPDAAHSRDSADMKLEVLRASKRRAQNSAGGC